ncbi:MAG TPA: trypsin-like serine protease [Polyangiaceae bacterium]|nr:trypsin-like serine protease [Polyangiaceae bacterium]
MTLGALLLSAALCGCSSSESLARDRLGVIGGTETGEDHDGVVYVTAEIATVGGSAITKAGSGALLAPNLLVTALHVVSRNPSNVPFTCDATGSDVSGSPGSQLGGSVAPEKIAVYAGPYPDGEPIAYGAELVTSGSTTICQNDIAFVVLDRALELPATAVHRGRPAEVGEVLTAVGFGGEDASQLNPRTAREVDVTAVGQWIRTFTVSEGPCEGDSGGPALAATGELVGVFSSVSMDCTNANASAKYTDVSFFSPLVEAAFDAAGAGSPWPAAEGGAAGALAVEPAAAGMEGASAGAAGTGSAEPPVGSGPDDSGCALRGSPPGGTRCAGLLVLGLFVAARSVRRAPRRRR